MQRTYVATFDPPSASLEAPETQGLRRIVPLPARRGSVVPRPVRKLAGPAMLLLAWIGGSAAGWISSDILPAPEVLLAALHDLIVSGDLLDAMVVSVQRVVIGFAIGLSVGGCLAVLSGLFLIGEDLIDASMQMIRTMPWAGLIPLLIIWLGIYEEPKIALIALAVSFPIYINVFAGIRNVDQVLIEAAQTIGLRRLQLIRHVIMPGALPSSLVGLRYAIGSAWLALVFAEQVNSQAGLGYLITHAREVYRVDIIIVCLVIYALLGVAADVIVRLLERALLAWRPSFTGT